MVIGVGDREIGIVEHGVGRDRESRSRDIPAGVQLLGAGLRVLRIHDDHSVFHELGMGNRAFIHWPVVRPVIARQQDDGDIAVVFQTLEGLRVVRVAGNSSCDLIYRYRHKGRYSIRLVFDRDAAARGEAEPGKGFQNGRVLFPGHVSLCLAGCVLGANGECESARSLLL